MTLVFRSPKLAEAINNQNPGPGAYKTEQQSLKNTQPSASFLSKVDKSIPTMEESDLSPFTYFRDGSSPQEKCEANLSVFKSKIERFGRNGEEKNNGQSRQKQFAKQFNELMKKERSEHSKKGRLIGQRLKKQIQQKITDVQNLPSIPNSQQSAGYRVDSNNKLVCNYNPKILFTSTIKTNQSQDFYFHRSHNSLTNNKKCIINTSSKRVPNQLTHQLSYPTVNTYNANKYLTIEQIDRKTKKSNHYEANQPRFPNNSSTKKEMLRLNKMKKDFQKYIVKDKIDITSLQKLKFENKLPQKVTAKSPYKIEKNQLQCFLSKESRFKKQELKKQTQSNIKKDEIKVETKQSKPKIGQSLTSERIKQPFDLGKQRFEQKHKQALGPGSYQLKQEIFNHGISLKQNQERFKNLAKQTCIPGPGTYQFCANSELKQSVKLRFNKYRNNDYFNQVKHKKQHSMEDLYQQVGKRLNYLNKIQKQETMKKKNKHSPMKRNLDYPSLESINQAKKVLRQKLSLKIEDKIQLRQKQNINMQMKTPKCEHLYQYVKPEERGSLLGPGYYNIETTLDRKTFNKTVTR